MKVCPHCRFIVKEQIRNVATLFSTGFIFNEIFMVYIIKNKLIPKDYTACKIQSNQFLYNNLL